MEGVKVPGEGNRGGRESTKVGTRYGRSKRRRSKDQVGSNGRDGKFGGCFVTQHMYFHRKERGRTPSHQQPIQSKSDGLTHFPFEAPAGSKCNEKSRKQLSVRANITEQTLIPSEQPESSSIQAMSNKRRNSSSSDNPPTHLSLKSFRKSRLLQLSRINIWWGCIIFKLLLTISSELLR